MNGNLMNAPGVNDLARYGVNVKNVAQVVAQPLYHYQAYAAAGAANFTFFQNPQGAGGLTLEDTNMESAGQLPAPKLMLVLGIQVCFWSGAAGISVSGAAAAATAASQSADLNAVRDRGHVQFYVGSKAQYDDAGLEHFPTNQGIRSESALADASTAAVDQISVIDYAQFGGPPTRITPLVLQSNQNFRVTIGFPNGAVAMPSGQDARIGVRLVGYQYRLAQ